MSPPGTIADILNSSWIPVPSIACKSSWVSVSCHVVFGLFLLLLPPPDSGVQFSSMLTGSWCLKAQYKSNKSSTSDYHSVLKALDSTDTLWKCWSSMVYNTSLLIYSGQCIHVSQHQMLRQNQPGINRHVGHAHCSAARMCPVSCPIIYCPLEEWRLMSSWHHTGNCYFRTSHQHSDITIRFRDP